MPLYDFIFTPAYAGQSAAISDTSGNAVEGSPFTLDADGATQIDLPGGTYKATASNAALGMGTSTTAGVLNLNDSLDAPGSGETAYLVATASTFATDASTHTLTLAADDREDALPDWLSIAAGEVVLGEDCGGCVFSVRGQFDIDYSGTTPADAPDEISASIGILSDGVEYLVSPEVMSAADGLDSQTSASVIIGGFITQATLSMFSVVYNSGVNVADGVVTPRVAFTITRVAPAPVLPA